MVQLALACAAAALHLAAGRPAHPAAGIVRRLSNKRGIGALGDSVPGALIGGNGDLGLVIGSAAAGPGMTLAMGKNDFWGWPGEHVIFGGTFNHFSPGWLTLVVSPAGGTPRPTPWNATKWGSVNSTQRLVDGHLTLDSADLSAGGYGLRSQAVVLSHRTPRNTVMVNVSVSCPKGVTHATVSANLSSANDWVLPVAAAVVQPPHPGGFPALQLRKKNQPTPWHPTLLTPCTPDLLVDGIRSFAVDNRTQQLRIAANGTATAPSALCLATRQGDQRVITVRCGRGDASSSWFWRPRTHAVGAHASPSNTGRVTSEDGLLCMVVANTNSTRCNPCPWGKNGGCPNQPPPRTQCRWQQYAVKAEPCAAAAKLANTSLVWRYDARRMHLEALLPAPPLHIADRVPNFTSYCLTAAEPTVSNNVAVVARFGGAGGQSQPAIDGTGESTAGFASANLTLQCGQTYSVVIGVATERDAAAADVSDELVLAEQFATVPDRTARAAMLAEHQQGWLEFWNASSVEFGLQSQPVEFATVFEWYYCSLYLLRSSTRVGAVPPSIWGPWTVTDVPKYADQMTLDYNFQANFWSAQTSNHAELILPYVDTVLRLVPLAKRRAALPDWSLGGRPHMHGGAVQCMGCGSQGQPSPSVEGDWDDCGGCPPGFGGFRGLEFPSAMGPFAHQTFPLDNGDRFVGGLIATNLVQHFDATQDAVFLRDKLLPLLRGLAEFYLSYSVPSTSGLFGPFGVRHGALASERSLPFTCAQEVCHGGGSAEHNAHQDLAYLRMTLGKLLYYTDPDPAVGSAAATPAERAAWRQLLSSLAAFPTVTASVKQDLNRTVNRTIFSEAETTVSNSSNHTTLPNATRGSSYWHANMGYPITHVAAMYPAAVVQRGSDPRLVKIARATVLTAGECFPEPTCAGWTPPNGYCLLWPAAGRLASREDSAGPEGLSARYLLTHFGRSLNTTMRASGWPEIMGGLEELGAVDAVHAMLVQNDEDVLRLFPGWPSSADAAFTTLRLSGGFLVSARYDAATRNVTSARVVSDAGRRLTVENPWGGGHALCVRNVSAGAAGEMLPTTSVSGGHVRVQTIRGGRYELEPCGVMPPATAAIAERFG